MRDCERCGAKCRNEYELFDYCAQCGKNLCYECMQEGCCGKVPADSGEKADAGDEDTEAK